MAGIVGLTELQHTSGNSAMTIDTSGNLTVKTGTTTVKGEGTATTNLQQGLVKTWVSIDDSSTAAAQDSFNVGSITDAGALQFEINFTNNMGNGHYSAAGMAGNDGTTTGYRNVVVDNTPATSNFHIRNVNGGSDPNVLCLIAGDLA